MTWFLLNSVVIVLLCGHVLSQDETTAQSICDSMGSVGLYPNPNDATCKQYAECFMNNGALTGAFYNCTGSTWFNPNTQYCTTSYTCAVTTTTTEATTTSTTTTTTAATTTTTTVATTTTTIGTTTTTETPISAQNICDSQNAVGRYPNPDDTSCKEYAYCFENGGSLSGSFYNCTGTTLFDPSLQLCTTGYACSE